MLERNSRHNLKETAIRGFASVGLLFLTSCGKAPEKGPTPTPTAAPISINKDNSDLTQISPQVIRIRSIGWGGGMDADKILKGIAKIDAVCDITSIAAIGNYAYVIATTVEDNCLQKIED